MTEPAEAPAAGHNSGVAGTELRSFIQRVEKLETEKADIATDIKDVFAEAKGRGFNTKTIRRIIRERKRDATERAKAEALFETYCSALGIFG